MEFFRNVKEFHGNFMKIYFYFLFEFYMESPSAFTKWIQFASLLLVALEQYNVEIKSFIHNLTKYNSNFDELKKDQTQKQ